MSEKVIVLDMHGNQISPKPNALVKFFKTTSGREIVNYLRQVPAYVQAVKDMIPTESVKVVFSEHTQELLNSGAYFGESKYGGLAANLFIPGQTGTVGQLSFNMEQLVEYSSSLPTSINQLMIQQQFGEMIALLDHISENIGRVLIGQQNDRIALCLGSEQLLLEATVIVDESLRRQVLISALQMGQQARASLTKTFIDDVSWLDSHKTSFVKSYKNDILPKTQAIKQSIIANYRATKVCAMVYAELGEHEAMKKTFLAFEELLSTTLSSKTLEKLNSIDSDSSGFWLDTPKKMLNEISQCINSKDALAIEFPAALLKGEINNG